MEYVAFFAIPIGLVVGLFIGYRLSKLLSIWFSKFARAPRLVEHSSLAVALLFLIFSFPMSIYVGGMLGGGLGESLSVNLSIRSVGVPVGIAIGIAVTYTSCIVIGATLGGLIGKLLSHFLPDAFLSWRSSRSTRD